MRREPDDLMASDLGGLLQLFIVACSGLVFRGAVGLERPESIASGGTGIRNILHVLIGFFNALHLGTIVALQLDRCAILC